MSISWVQRSSKSFSPAGSDGKPVVAQYLDAVDRNGNVLATLTKDTSGTVSLAVGGVTLGGSSSVSDTAYDATTWDAVTDVAPSKNAVRDKIEALAATIPTVDDTAYNATTWDAVTTVAPSKNAVRDKIEALAATIPAAGPTNSAGSNVIPKSDGTNFVASGLSDDGTSATVARYLKLTNAGTVSLPQINFGTATTGIWGESSSQVCLTYSGVRRVAWDFANNIQRFDAGGAIGWSNNSGDPTQTNDVGLKRASAGLLKVTDGGSTNLGKLAIAGGTPASAGATGVAGQILWDTGFIYVCTATNTWLRAAIATW